MSRTISSVTRAVVAAIAVKVSTRGAKDANSNDGDGIHHIILQRLQRSHIHSLSFSLVSHIDRSSDLASNLEVTECEITSGPRPLEPSRTRTTQLAKRSGSH